LRRRASLGNASVNPTSWPRTRPGACAPLPAGDGGRPGRPGCYSASGNRGSGSASTLTAGTYASTRGNAPKNSNGTVRGEGRALSPWAALESMRRTIDGQSTPRQGRTFLIPNRPKEVVQLAPRPRAIPPGRFPPEVASRVGFSRAVARACKRR
jgi:hypothetical protein